MDEMPPVSNVSITDLPNEVLEMVIPDRKPQTISTLKLVNKRFYHLLSSDRYYKEYLIYPEKTFVCAMKNGKSSGKEVIEDIKSGTVGKWEGNLKLEHLHLNHWKCGTVTRSDVVPLPPQGPAVEVDRIWLPKWQDLIDEDGEHWLLSLRIDGTIVFMNITNEPKVFVERDIPARSVMLIPGQVLCDSPCRSRITVLNFVITGNEVFLQYNFDFEFSMTGWDWWVVTTNKRNIFVSINRINFNGLLHFRDLDNGSLLEDVCLWDYECLSGLMKPTDEDGYWLDAYLVNRRKTNHPYFILVIRVMRSLIARKSLLVVFNVDNMKDVTVVDFKEDAVVNYYITSTFLYIIVKRIPGRFYDVYGISLEKLISNKNFITPMLVYNYCNVRDNFPSISSINGKLFLIYQFHWYPSDTVLIVDVSEGEVNQELEVSLHGVDCCNSKFHMIRPGFLVAYPFDYRLNNQVRIFKLTKEENGVVAAELIDWFQTFVASKINFLMPTPVLDSQDLSKLVCYDEHDTGNSDLVIFHF